MVHKIKKFLSAALALMLTLVLVMPAFAASNDGTITINNAESDRKYQAYRLFDLSFDGEHYGYTLNDQWKEFLTTGEGADKVTIDETNGNVKLKKDSAADVQELAQKAKAYADAPENKDKVTVYTPTGTAPTLTFSHLPLGYYLVTTEAGGLCALDTTNKETVMFEKNTAPTIGKTADKTNAEYGDTVHYEIPFTRGGYVWGDYVVTDIMTGLELTDEQVKGVKITVKDQNIGEPYTVNYTKDFPKLGSNTLKVTIPADTLKKYPSGTEFVLEYEAVAKKTVSMDNNVSMEYKNGPKEEDKDKTPEYEVKVANYEFVVKKTDEGGKVLNGATFALYRDKACAEVMNFIRTDHGYRLAEKNESGVPEIAAGEVTIEGLAAGTYYLKEIAAPDGYNKLINPVEIAIAEQLNHDSNSKYHGQAFDKDGKRLDPTIMMNGEDISETGIVTVINKTGTELPSTGGVGTTVFYVVGAVLILAAVVILFVKKRMAR